MASELIGVVLMSYGTPKGPEEVAPYYTSIRGGRVPTDKEIAELAQRYDAIGGTTPLLEISQQAASALEKRLNASSSRRYKVYVGMRHWHPFISETVQEMAADGVTHIVGVPLAPHFSEMSIGGYRTAVEDGLRTLPKPPTCSFVESWYQNPLFIKLMAQRIHTVLATFPAADRDTVEVIFSAHSLPKRIQQWNDPYPEELRHSSEIVAKAAGLASWGFTFQSAGRTRDPWLGPDILETIGLKEHAGKSGILIVPIGFVCDNLEILYDIDVQAQELAKNVGIALKRTEMPNADPAFIDVLADVVANGTGARVRELDPNAPTPTHSAH